MPINSCWYKLIKNFKYFKSLKTRITECTDVEHSISIWLVEQHQIEDEYWWKIRKKWINFWNKIKFEIKKWEKQAIQKIW